MSTKGNALQHTSNIQAVCITEEDLFAAMEKVELPMPIQFSKDKDNIIGNVVELFRSEYLGEKSIGAIFELHEELLDDKLKLSIGFTCVPTLGKNEEIELLAFRIKLFFIEKSLAYDDIAPVHLLGETKMIKCKTDSIMSIIANPTKENIAMYGRGSYVISVDELRLAVSKVKLPMVILEDYREDLPPVGVITELFESVHNGLFSIGAHFNLMPNNNFKYVSVGFSFLCKDEDSSSNTKFIKDVEIVNAAAFTITGYDDVAEFKILED